MTEKIILFYGHRKGKKVTDSCLSQFYPCVFTVDGEKYNCAEQFMMAEKARAFGDETNRAKILVESKPAKIKALGRRVKPFDAEMWATIAPNVVAVGNFAKFSQNPELRDFLLKTGDAVLAEASPVDRIWGIGLAKDDPAGKNPKKWRGKNLLGLALIMVREELKSGGDEVRFEKDHPYAPFDKNILQPLLDSLRAKEEARKSARRAQLEAKHATPAWQEHQAVVKARAAAKAPVKAKRERARDALDMSVPSPKTDRRYLQESVLPAYQRITAGSPTRTDEQVIADFDRKYRPFIYRKMLDEKGAFQFKPVSVKIDNVTVMIPMRGNISGADIWTNVCTKLFKVALSKFDFTADKVGQGAFRSFLVTMAYHEYVNIVRLEKQKRRMVPARDIHGHVRYTFNKKHQRVPIMVPRETGDVDEAVVAVAERDNSLAVAAEKGRKAALELLLNEYYRLFPRFGKKQLPDAA